MQSNSTKAGRRAGLLVEHIGDEVVIYDRATRKIHRLNRTAAAIWQLGARRCSAAQLLGRLRRQPGMARVSQHAVAQALARLQDTGLLARPASPSTARNKTRPQARARGVVIASIEAPTPLMTASNALCGLPCSSNTDCQAATDGCVYCGFPDGHISVRFINGRAVPVATPMVCMSTPPA
jgi:hypothetical protein